ncbi:MAG: hypothetical protein IPM79_25370 [Polyangiaceae bacterium]|nr:hypothetical protein [Polyangiaceae bacterium]
MIERPEYAAHREALGRFDEMVDTLSLAKASGTLSSFAGTPIFALYEAGARAQAAIERTLATQLAEAGGGREKILARWMR